jgi:hypothetical protein
LPPTKWHRTWRKPASCTLNTTQIIPIFYKTNELNYLLFFRTNLWLFRLAIINPVLWH